MEKELEFRKKNLVPKEIAIELIQLGFDEVVIGGYYEDGTFAYHPDSDIVIDVPLFQQAFRWFREKHNLYPRMSGNENYTSFSLGMKFLSFVRADKTKNHYQEAEIECLKQLIKLIK